MTTLSVMRPVKSRPHAGVRGVRHLIERCRRLALPVGRTAGGVRVGVAPQAASGEPGRLDAPAGSAPVGDTCIEAAAPHARLMVLKGVAFLGAGRRG